MIIGSDMFQFNANDTSRAQRNFASAIFAAAALLAAAAALPGCTKQQNSDAPAAAESAAASGAGAAPGAGAAVESRATAFGGPTVRGIFLPVSLRCRPGQYRAVASTRTPAAKFECPITEKGEFTIGPLPEGATAELYIYEKERPVTGRLILTGSEEFLQIHERP